MLYEIMTRAVNKTQVQATNDASIISKCSTASKGYIDDEFVEEFVVKKHTRTSLIHLGYYSRAIILERLFMKLGSFCDGNNTSKLQIVSCGCGFDTTFWKLKQKKYFPRTEVVYVEVDFPAVLDRKIDFIRNSPKLLTYVENVGEAVGAVRKLSTDYWQVRGDLADVEELLRNLQAAGIDAQLSTLFTSECAITYMTKNSSDNLLEKIAACFPNSCFVNYEQIHPDDGFGSVMLDHFSSLHSPLLSVHDYGTCASQADRYTALGFHTSAAVSEWQALLGLTSQSELDDALSREQFDEFEELYLKFCHYVLCVTARGMLQPWVDRLFSGHPPKTIPAIGAVPACTVRVIPHDLCLYAHTGCVVEDEVVVLGGLGRTGRSQAMWRLAVDPKEGVATMQACPTLVTGDIPRFVHGCSESFELSGKTYMCIYGGRTSPDTVVNKDVVVLDSTGETVHVVRKPCLVPRPRYRTSMVKIQVGDNSVTFLVFGGRFVDQGKIERQEEMWELIISSHESLLERSWSPVLTEEEPPCNRMSHSCAVAGSTMYLSGGLERDRYHVLDDVWKFKFSGKTWQKLDLSGSMVPRFGHTSHVVGGALYLVGGVNTEAGRQPELGRVDLDTRSVVEYTFAPMLRAPLKDTTTADHSAGLLFNHTSHVLSTWIVTVGGGGSCFSFGTHFNTCLLSIDTQKLTNATNDL